MSTDAAAYFRPSLSVPSGVTDRDLAEIGAAIERLVASGASFEEATAELSRLAASMKAARCWRADRSPPRGWAAKRQ
ncbi:hypothetical protein SAMN06265365_1608 [Tistlia consotensis]|uniref:Uncharacterized protein n=1 Tax=Tistlia consotensis USBA 355 TaxID=560819 RepID=A0A1Y6CZK9_9PROT|nr:hypothetical protein SAMN05428998_1652 [Tistlia consotensis USBA 355]SNS38835.1 hypothetical protein SAMN06265365_1608 [Tistlia consotensis]